MARRRARECALQCLYQWDMTGASADALLHAYWQAHPATPKVIEFAQYLVRGTLGRLPEIDALIRAQAEHWRFERMGRVERSILRLGGYELLCEAETPAAVVIDEAIELCKRYCEPMAGQFINGVLDGMRCKIAASKTAANIRTTLDGSP
ncbi:MAG: transcription antitermination factor NusB [Acidobacteriota bacterium]